MDTMHEIRFPRSPEADLSLPRRRLAREPEALFGAAAAARDSIRAIVDATRTSFDPGAPGQEARTTDLARSLQRLELRLAEREWAIEEGELRLAERERDLAELEALAAARAKLVAAARRTPRSPVSADEQAALLRLRAELERQEAALEESRTSIRERERFLDESEERLFAKVQAQQEKEIELEQREEELLACEKNATGIEPRLDRQAAATFGKGVQSGRQPDEFKE